MADTLRETKQFIEVAALPETVDSTPDVEQGLYPFVTISRQVGAGGRSLAKALLAELEKQEGGIYHGWRVFDRDLCQKLVEEPSLRNSLNRLWSPEYHSEVESLILALLGSSTQHPAAARALFTAIRTVATIGKVIIVGRGGACITCSLTKGIHLRLTASESNRAMKMHLSNLSERAAFKILRRQENDRARLIKNYFNSDISDPLLYDSVWNTDRVPLEVIASSIVPLIRDKVGRFHV